MNPIFADEPIAAIAWAEAMGELPRSLNWRKPEWAAAVRFVRALLTGWRRHSPIYPDLTHRLGPCLVSFDVEEARWVLTIYAHIYFRPGRLPLGAGWTARAVLSEDPYVSVSTEFISAVIHAGGLKHLTVDLWAGNKAMAFSSDLRTLAQEIRGAMEKGWKG